MLNEKKESASCTQVNTAFEKQEFLFSTKNNTVTMLGMNGVERKIGTMSYKSTVSEMHEQIRCRWYDLTREECQSIDISGEIWFAVDDKKK
eukprot:6524798-Ditylum_brightwellii.AAC.1